MRRLGQHFLIKKSVLERIVKALEVEPTDTIIEIGPGHGELTKYLLDKSPKKLIAVEKDRDLVSSIQYLVSSDDRLEIIEGDILELLPKIANELKSQQAIKLVGNIPYYITGKLLRTLGQLEPKPERVVLTIQKEVALRLTAAPPKMNLLAASVGYWGKLEIVRFVPRGAFRPPPKVESAVVKITPHPTSPYKGLRGADPVKFHNVAGKTQPNNTESKAYYAFTKILFKQPRKTISNNLTSGSSITKKEVEKFLKSHGVEPNLRPQNLSISTINMLSHDFPREAV